MIYTNRISHFTPCRHVIYRIDLCRLWSLWYYSHVTCHMTVMAWSGINKQGGGGNFLGSNAIGTQALWGVWAWSPPPLPFDFAIFKAMIGVLVPLNDFIDLVTLCSPSSTTGTAACSPTSTFGTDNGAMQNNLNPIVLHLWTQWHCLELSITIQWIPIVSYFSELHALSLLLIFQ